MIFSTTPYFVLVFLYSYSFVEWSIFTALLYFIFILNFTRNVMILLFIRVSNRIMLHSCIMFLAMVHIRLGLWELMENKRIQNIFNSRAHMDQRRFHVTHMIWPILVMVHPAIKVDL